MLSWHFSGWVWRSGVLAERLRRRRVPAVRGHDLRMRRIQHVVRRHDLHAVLIEHVLDALVQCRHEDRAWPGRGWACLADEPVRNVEVSQSGLEHYGRGVGSDAV